MGVQVYAESLPCMTCAAENTDPFGDHATVCGARRGVVQRHENLRDDLFYRMFRDSELVVRKEVANLMPGSDYRPADLLVRHAFIALPPAPPTAPVIVEPPHSAFDVTVRQFYSEKSPRIPTHNTRESGAADFYSDDKLREFARKVKDVRNTNGCANYTPTFQFVPLAFDTLGAWSTRALDVLEKCAQLRYDKRGKPKAPFMHQVLVHTSFSIHASTSKAIARRDPRLPQQPS